MSAAAMDDRGLRHAHRAGVRLLCDYDRMAAGQRFARDLRGYPRGRNVTYCCYYGWPGSKWGESAIVAGHTPCAGCRKRWAYFAKQASWGAACRGDMS